MKRFLRFLGGIVIFVAVCICALRGIMGISFVMGDKAFYPPAGRFLQPEVDSFNFTILSDTGSKNWTLERLVSDAKRHTKPHFMLHLGDLVVYRNIEHMYWMMSELNEKLDGTPMYLIPGNHDVKKKKGVVDKTIFSRVFGPLYYWFSYGNTLFIGLDSSTEEIDDDQWRFFERVMTIIRPKFKYVILFTHVPPSVPEGERPHALKPDHVEKMTYMLKKYPVDAIFAGHVHYYSKQNWHGIPIYTVPPSGQYFGGPVQHFGYLNVAVDKTGIHVDKTYTDHRKASEWFKLFFVDLILTNKIRWIAGGILFGGLVIWLLGQKWLKFKL